MWCTHVPALMWRLEENVGHPDVLLSTLLPETESLIGSGVRLAARKPRNSPVSTSHATEHTGSCADTLPPT